MKKKIQSFVALVMCLCLCVGMTVPAFAADYLKPKDIAEQNCYTSGSIGCAESTGICGGVHYAGDVADPIQQTVSYQEGYKNVTDAVTDTVRWTLKDGVLTFSGSGSTAMGLNYLFEGNQYIETVVIEEGITNMPGLGYFQNIPNLKTIIIMDAGTYYNRLAYNCPNLKHIIVGANLKDSIFTGGTTFEFDKTILLSKNVASYATSEYAQGITVRNDCNVYVHKTTSGQFITNGVISDTSGWNDINAKNFFRDNTVVPYSQILAAAQSALADVPASVLAKLPAELFEDPKEEPVVPVQPVIPVEPVQPTEPVAPEETTPETMIGTNDVANTETHLRTSYSESNYMDISVSGNTLTVSGRILADGLTEVQVKCGSKTENVRVSSGELFSARITLTHSGKATVNVYTYQGTSSGWSIIYNRIYIEKTASGYRIMPSLVQENNTAFAQAKIDPQATLNTEVPASVAAMSNAIVGSVTDDYTKVFLLHKWVAENIYYDYDALYGRSQRITDSAGVLEARRSVCEGYSRLLVDLILAQGIPAMYCTNLSTDGSYALRTSGGELHAHAEACVGGRWIIMDATWDSRNKYRNGTYNATAPSGYYYFDISSEAFAMDHNITSRGNVYNITDDFSDEETEIDYDNSQNNDADLVSQLKEAVKNGDTARQEEILEAMRNGKAEEERKAAEEKAKQEAIEAEREAEEQAQREAIIGDKKVSEWAKVHVANAIEADLVPETGLGNDYTKAITRAQFCALAVRLYETMVGTEITGRSTFTDTDDVNVQKLASIGVVAGYGNGVFGPNDPITREQSSTMLYRLREAAYKAVHEKYDVTYTPDTTFKNTELPFNDAPASWAKEGIQYCYANNIMNGYGQDANGNNLFGCRDAYSIEQSIITMGRSFMSPYDIINE